MLGPYDRGLGATELTFLDDEVTEFFSPLAAGKRIMFLVALVDFTSPARDLRVLVAGLSCGSLAWERSRFLRFMTVFQLKTFKFAITSRRSQNQNVRLRQAEIDGSYAVGN